MNSLRVIFFSWWLFYGWTSNHLTPSLSGPFQSEVGCLRAAKTVMELSQLLGRDEVRVLKCILIDE